MASSPETTRSPRLPYRHECRCKCHPIQEQTGMPSHFYVCCIPNPPDYKPELGFEIRLGDIIGWPGGYKP